MIRIIGAISVAALLGACSTPLKLDSVPVEDRSTSVPSGNADNAAGRAGQSRVTPVDLGKGNAGDALNLDKRTVYFDYDSFAIRAEFQTLIETSAKTILINKTPKVTIEGHTDERGGREYNLALGQKRAEAVKRALIVLGVGESQLESVSFGKEKPAVIGSTDAAMEKNRRAEISYR